MAYYFKIIKYFIGLCLIAVGVVFGINNQAVISIDLYPISNAIRVPSYLALFSAFFFGSVIAIAFFGMEYFKKSLKARSFKKELEVFKSQEVRPVDENQYSDVPITKEI